VKIAFISSEVFPYSKTGGLADIAGSLQDVHLPYHYSSNAFRGKLKNKKFLLEHFSLPYDKDIPLIAIIS